MTAILLRPIEHTCGSASAVTAIKGEFALPAIELLRGRRIVIFAPRPDFATNPMLNGLLAGLMASGANVDLVIPPEGTFPPMRTAVSQVPYPIPRRELLAQLLWKPSRHAAHLALSNLALMWKCGTGAYDLAIAVDPEGLVTAARYCSPRTPLAFFSFEIFFQHELRTPGEREAKRLEVAASLRTALAVVQDETRAALLSRENEISMQNMVYVPVAPTRLPRAENTRFWHRKLGLQPHDRVVLHTGSFDSWTYDDVLLETVAAWPDGFVLVVHVRRRDARLARYFAQRSPSRVYFCDDVMSIDQYDELVASTDIGLALYNPSGKSKFTGDNIHHIGLSSGKFAYYIKYGVPVITVRNSYYRDLFKRHPVGEHLESFLDLPAALHRVAANSAVHRAACERLFDEIAFDARWPELGRRLGLVTRQGR